MRRATVLLFCLLLVATSACGSRSDDGGSATTNLDGTQDEGTPKPDSDKIGTLDNPCSKDTPEGEVPADAVGITDDTIRIGVISDRENPAVPLPTVGIEESVQAFVDFCNDAGGINGRQIELEKYDSMISNTEAATNSACRAELFSLVGTGSVQDQQGITTREECGLPEVAGYAATAQRAESKFFFEPVPGNFADKIGVGACQWIAKEHPDAVKTAAMLYTDLPAASSQGLQAIDACEAEAGFDFVVNSPAPFGEGDWSTYVSEMKTKGVEYFSMVSSSSETLGVLEEMAKQDVVPEVIDLGQQYYDPAIAEAEVADGALVQTNTFPFSEADDNPALGLYVDLMEESGNGDIVSSLGVQAFSAALLWATATKSLGNDLSRQSLLDELATIKDWDGGGLHPPSNPGDHAPFDCFLYLKVTDGEFVREYPEEGSDCDPDYIYTSDERFE